MRLELFNLIDETTHTLEQNLPTFQYIEKRINLALEGVLSDCDQELISISSRIKSPYSLKEKILRNKYYLECQSAKEVLSTLPDLIGVTINCRFIAEERDIYKEICRAFHPSHEHFFVSGNDENLYLDLKMPQPQQQQNGFILYRIDGYYEFNHERINFELQIRSMVHRFWSDIEHQVVYKNKHFIYNDSFMKQMLSSVHDSMEVVDHQLQIIYQQMVAESQNSYQFAVGERNVKMFLAKSISDLYTTKMIDSLGFTTDFKRSSAILSHYIYIHDFMRTENPSLRMMDYIEHFHLLKTCEIDFTQPILIEERSVCQDSFCEILSQYWSNAINVDYEWHVFFYMLFIINVNKQGQDFESFAKTIKEFIVSQSWLNERFEYLGNAQAEELKDTLMSSIAKAMVKTNKVSVVHEDKLFKLRILFQQYVEEYEEKLKASSNTYSIHAIAAELEMKVSQIF